jgi:hypothetical protein
MGNKPVYNKSNINFFIDALLLLVFSAIIGIGLMIKYVLLTGEQKREIFGANIEQTFWGLDRHGWGDIHLYLGFASAALLLLHIIFHWSMIVAMFKKFFENIKLKNAIAIIFLSLCLFLTISPLLIQPKNGGIESKHIDMEPNAAYSDKDAANNIAEAKTKNEAVPEVHKERVLNIRGYMSIAEVCKNYKVPAKHFKEKLGVPASTPDNTVLSILRKQYGIKMSDIEKVIIAYSNKK